MRDTREKIWDLIETFGIANEDEMRLVTDINGYSPETLMDIIYARTGLRSLEQVFDKYGDMGTPDDFGFDEEEMEIF